MTDLKPIFSRRSRLIASLEVCCPKLSDCDASSNPELQSKMDMTAADADCPTFWSLARTARLSDYRAVTETLMELSEQGKLLGIRTGRCVMETRAALKVLPAKTQRCDRSWEKNRTKSPMNLSLKLVSDGTRRLKLTQLFGFHTANNQNKGPTRPMIDLKPVFSRRSRLIA